MAIPIDSAAEIAAKWVEVTPGRAGYYKAKAPAAASLWESNTKASQATYQAAVTAGDIGRRYLGGVSKAGAAKFSRKVIEVGGDRFGPGCRAALPDYQSGFEPYQSVIAGLTLSKKAPRGDSSNYKRVEEVGTALTRKRLSLLGAGG